MSNLLKDLHQRVQAYHANLLELRKKESSAPEANVSNPKLPHPAANGGQKSFGKHPATSQFRKDEIVPGVAAGTQPGDAPAGKDAPDNRDEYVGGDITPGAKAANDLMALIQKGCAIKGGPAAEGIAKAALSDKKANGGQIKLGKDEIAPAAPVTSAHDTLMGHLKKPVSFTAKDNAFFAGAGPDAPAPAPAKPAGRLPGTSRFSGMPVARAMKNELSKAETQLMSLLKQEIYIDHSGKAEGKAITGSDRLVEVGAVKEAKASNPFKEGKKAVSKKVGDNKGSGGKITKGKGGSKEESSGEESSEESSGEELSKSEHEDSCQCGKVDLPTEARVIHTDIGEKKSHTRHQCYSSRKAYEADEELSKSLKAPKANGGQITKKAEPEDRRKEVKPVAAADAKRKEDKADKEAWPKGYVAKGELEKKDMLAPPGKLNALTPSSNNKPGGMGKIGAAQTPMVKPQQGAAAGKPPAAPGASDMKPPTATVNKGEKKDDKKKFGTGHVKPGGDEGQMSGVTHVGGSGRKPDMDGDIRKATPKMNAVRRNAHAAVTSDMQDINDTDHGDGLSPGMEAEWDKSAAKAKRIDQYDSREKKRDTKKYEMSKAAKAWGASRQKANGGQITKKGELDKGAMFDENMTPTGTDSNQMTAQMAHPKAATQLAGTGTHGQHARAVPVKRPAAVDQPLRRSEQK